jgi:hypothetical protein
MYAITYTFTSLFSINTYIHIPLHELYAEDEKMFCTFSHTHIKMIHVYYIYLFKGLYVVGEYAPLGSTIMYISLKSPLLSTASWLPAVPDTWATCVCCYVHVYMCMCICVCVYVYVYVYVYVCDCVYAYALYVYVHVHIYVYAYVYAYVCICICMCAKALLSQ